jgi:hypothetical protein
VFLGNFKSRYKTSCQYRKLHILVQNFISWHKTSYQEGTSLAGTKLHTRVGNFTSRHKTSCQDRKIYIQAQNFTSRYKTLNQDRKLHILVCTKLRTRSGNLITRYKTSYPGTKLYIQVENFSPGNVSEKSGTGTGLPDFSWYKLPKRGKIYQITTNYTKCP